MLRQICAVGMGLACLCASCSDGSLSAPRGGAVVLDTANAIEWRISSPVDSIGPSTGVSGHQFGRIVGVHVWQDGRVSIVDDASLSAELFERSGNRLSHTGRRGRGPGEFQSVVLIGPVGLGRLLLYDPLLARLTLVDTARGAIATVSIASDERRSYLVPRNVVGSRLVVAEQGLPAPAEH